MKCKADTPRTPTPEQQQLIDFLNLEEHDLDVWHLRNSEYAWKNWSANARKVYETAKHVCRVSFLPNPAITLLDCIQATLTALLEREAARKFASLKSDREKLAFVIATTKSASYKTTRRRSEFQFTRLEDRDYSVKSSNLNDGGLLTGRAERVYAVDHVPERRADWTLANEYENALIAKIDRERGEEPELVPTTEYEHARAVLNDDDLDFFWTYRTDIELGKKQSRPARSSAERKRYSRLRKKVEESRFLQ